MVEAAVVPLNEAGRIAAVRRYDVLDTPPDGAFERITSVAARLFRVPISIVSLVDTDRIWFKSHHGIDVGEVSRDPGLCASAILGDGPWLVTDASTDSRTLANPLVAGELGLRFYAGAPLRTHDGFNLGTLCVIDREPREIRPEEVATLADLAAVVMDELELRLDARRTVGLEAELRRRAESIASTLQESLVPPSLPTIEGLDLATRYHVAQRDQVGGDFFDVVRADWGTAVVVGDACGKGTGAAALAGAARWTLHSVTMDEPDPAASLARLNSVLSHWGEDERYVTAAVASLRPGGGGTDVAVASGGQPRPLALGGDGTVEPVGGAGPLVGWFPSATFRSTTTVLGPADALVLFTDGLLECVAGRGETDDGAVRDLLRPMAGAPAGAIADCLDAAVGADRRDDAAFVVVRAG